MISIYINVFCLSFLSSLCLPFTPSSVLFFFLSKVAPFSWFLITCCRHSIELLWLLHVIATICHSNFFQDEEDVKAIARLFADMGDSYVELIATGIRYSLKDSIFIFFFEVSILLSFVVLDVLEYLLFNDLWHFGLLFHFSFFSGSDESMLIVQALLEVAAHPDYDISSMTYNFWHHLQVNLTRRWASCD